MRSLEHVRSITLAIGRMAGIADINELLLRQLAFERGQHTEAADPTVKDPDGTVGSCGARHQTSGRLHGDGFELAAGDFLLP